LILTLLHRFVAGGFDSIQGIGMTLAHTDLVTVLAGLFGCVLLAVWLIAVAVFFAKSRSLPSKGISACIAGAVFSILICVPVF
jgi:hypothetical protein